MKTIIIIFITLSGLLAQDWINVNSDGTKTYNLAKRLREINTTDTLKQWTSDDEKASTIYSYYAEHPEKLLATTPTTTIIENEQLTIKFDIIKLSTDTIISVLDYTQKNNTLEAHWVFDNTDDLEPDFEAYFSIKQISAGSTILYRLTNTFGSNSVQDQKLFDLCVGGAKQFLSQRGFFSQKFIF